jgi:hypothetical protein
MAAHAVDDHDQRRIIVSHDQHTILILFTPANQAQFYSFNLQTHPPEFK